MQDPYPLFSIFAVFGFFVALIPLPWHFQAWNAGTCIFMLWTSVASLIESVDSVMWRRTAANLAPVWCDISTKLLIGAGVGIPSASLCIQRRLFKIATMKTVTITRQDKRRAVFIDIAIGIGIPVLVMILHVVVQGHRFNIVEGVGCVPTIYNTPPAYPLVLMWPSVLGCISFVYASLTLRAFWRRRLEIVSVLSTSCGSLTTSRYLRLMLLSCVEIAANVPLGAYSMYVNVGGVPMARWTNWADVHYDFGFVEEIPAVIWRQDHQTFVAVEMGRWIYPCSAIVFFALFGFADEARRQYSALFWSIASKFGFQPRVAKGTLPSFCAPRPPKFNFSSTSGSFSPSSKNAPSQIIVHKLSTVDVQSDHDDVLPSYTPSISSLSSLTTPTSASSAAKGKAKMTFEDFENEKLGSKDIESGFITISLHDTQSNSHSSSSSAEEEGGGEEIPETPSPQFPTSYQSRFFEGPMSSPSLHQSVSHSHHQHSRSLSTDRSYEGAEEEGDDASVRISISDAYPASRPPTPAALYGMDIPASPRSLGSVLDTFGRRESRVDDDIV